MIYLVNLKGRLSLILSLLMSVLIINMSSCSFSRKSSDSSDGIAGTYKTKIIGPPGVANLKVTLNEDNTLRGTLNTTTETFSLVGSWSNIEFLDYIILEMRAKGSQYNMYLYIRDGMAYKNSSDMDAKYSGQKFIKVSSD